VRRAARLRCEWGACQASQFILVSEIAPESIRAAAVALQGLFSRRVTAVQAHWYFGVSPTRPRTSMWLRRRHRLSLRT